MNYISLKKYFHINEKKCNKIYFNRFESESSRKLGIKINDFECFYMMNEEILNLIVGIYKIDRWLVEILGTENLPYTARNYLVIKSLIEEIKSSNNMEGIYSTRKELIEMVGNSETPKKYKRFYGMVKKYYKLLNDPFLSVDSSLDVRALYDEILSKDVIKEKATDEPDGVIFRSESVEINSGTKIIHRGVSKEKNIIEMMDKSLRVLNDEKIELLIRTAIFHYLFEYIHPFYNGNGRMGRFLVSAYLSKELNILSALQFSIACTHNKKKYYESFELSNDVRNKSDLTPFIISFLEIYYLGLKELKENINDTINIYCSIKEKMNNYIDEKYKDFMDLLLQATLFKTDGVTMKNMVSLTLKTEQTIRSMIKDINRQHSLIKIEKNNKPYTYTIDIDFIANLREPL